jgi:hypothetical protein
MRLPNSLTNNSPPASSPRDWRYWCYYKATDRFERMRGFTFDPDIAGPRLVPPVPSRALCAAHDRRGHNGHYRCTPSGGGGILPDPAAEPAAATAVANPFLPSRICWATSGHSSSRSPPNPGSTSLFQDARGEFVDKSPGLNQLVGVCNLVEIIVAHDSLRTGGTTWLNWWTGYGCYRALPARRRHRFAA